MQKPMVNAAGRCNLPALLLYYATDEGFDKLVESFIEKSRRYHSLAVKMNENHDRAKSVVQSIADVLPPQLQVHEDQLEMVFPVLFANMFPEDLPPQERQVRDGVLFLRAIATG